MNDLEYNDYSLNITPNPLSMKEIIDKMDFIKMKKKHQLCKRQCQENWKIHHKLGENICKTHI